MRVTQGQLRTAGMAHVAEAVSVVPFKPRCASRTGATAKIWNVRTIREV